MGASGSVEKSPRTNGREGEFKPKKRSALGKSLLETLRNWECCRRGPVARCGKNLARNEINDGQRYVQTNDLEQRHLTRAMTGPGRGEELRGKGTIPNKG